MQEIDSQINLPLEFNYHILRIALERYGKNLTQLDGEEYQVVCQQARKSFDLESMVLRSSEAGRVTISENHLEKAVQEVSARYESRQAYLQDLESNGMDEQALRQAIYRELKFDGVMQTIAAREKEISEVDVSLFYEIHRERFETPEIRQARHIMLTVNDDFPENQFTAALGRMEQIIQKLAGRTNRFAHFAKCYSECPTAMDGGKLGDVKRGQLYPELDAILFTMTEGEVSPIVETEIGFHILLCEKIRSPKTTPLGKVRPRIREMLQQRHRRNHQRAWLDSLKRASDKGSDPCCSGQQLNNIG